MPRCLAPACRRFPQHSVASCSAQTQCQCGVLCDAICPDHESTCLRLCVLLTRCVVAAAGPAARRQQAVPENSCLRALWAQPRPRLLLGGCGTAQLTQDWADYTCIPALPGCIAWQCCCRCRLCQVANCSCASANAWLHRFTVVLLYWLLSQNLNS